MVPLQIQECESSELGAPCSWPHSFEGQVSRPSSQASKLWHNSGSAARIAANRIWDNICIVAYHKESSGIVGKAPVFNNGGFSFQLSTFASDGLEE